MYYRVLVLCFMSLPLLCRQDVEIESIQFNDICMEAWTQADVIKAITISAEGKAEVLDKILGLLARAYGVFNQIQNARSSSSKSYCSDKIMENTFETLDLMRMAITETFEGSANEMAYATSLNLLDLMMQKLVQLQDQS